MKTNFSRSARLMVLLCYPIHRWPRELLTGKFSYGHTFKRKDNRGANLLLFESDHFHRALKAVEQLKPIAHKFGTDTGPTAICWVSSQNNTCAIAGARNGTQARQDAASLHLDIPKSDMDKIGEIEKIVTDHLDNRSVMWNW